jgi:hypothetical protein
VARRETSAGWTGLMARIAPPDMRVQRCLFQVCMNITELDRSAAAPGGRPPTEETYPNSHVRKPGMTLPHGWWPTTGGNETSSSSLTSKARQCRGHAPAARENLPHDSQTYQGPAPVHLP